MADSTKYLQLGFYCEDDEFKLYGPFKSMKECEKYDYTNIWELKKVRPKDCKISKILIDFYKSEITIEGEPNASIQILTDVLGVGTHSFSMDIWELVVAKAKEACNNIVYDGFPTTKGEYLNEMLHL